MKNISAIANTCLACMLTSVSAIAAPPTDIQIIGERIFPESITSDKQGTVFVGSIGQRAVFRAAPGALTTGAEPWIKPGAGGMQVVFGVFADDKANTLWICSNPSRNPPIADAPAALLAFDLTTAAPKGSYALPTPGAFCNDIAVDRDGNTYATDTANMEVVRLPKGGTSLQGWAGNGAFGSKGSVLDGIAVVGRRVIVNTLATSKLFSVVIEKRGQAGKITEITLDRPIERPDGMRAVSKNSLMLVESGGPGRLSRVVLDGDAGRVTGIKEGFPGGPVAVTVVGKMAYVVEAQFKAMRQTDNSVSLLPFRAIAVPVSVNKW